MQEMRNIEIDFDVHKKIELERTSFSESDNDVLRRLLNIDGPKPQIIDPATIGRPWSGKGVDLPHGTKVRMEYNGRTHLGEISHGEWLVEGASYNSPSAAAGGVAVTRKGGSPSLDGWTYWSVKKPGDSRWSKLSALRGK